MNGSSSEDKKAAPVESEAHPEKKSGAAEISRLPSVGEKVFLAGKIARGVIRGHDLIERLSDRLHGVLGFMPYHGTVNVRIEQPINIEDFETKRIEHILLDGSVWIDARMAPIKLTFKDRTIDAWIIFDERGLHEEDMLEVIHEERLMDTLNLRLGDDVSVELTKVRRTLKSRLKELLRPFWPRATRIMRM